MPVQLECTVSGFRRFLATSELRQVHHEISSFICVQ